MTVNVRPATVSVPVRLLVPVFAVTAKVTVPSPEPLAPPVTDSQDVLLLAADHVHPSAAVTPTVDEPAAAGIDRLVGEIAGAQVTVNVNALVGSLGATPPGPTAAARAS
jgi:hypothetical protein